MSKRKSNIELLRLVSMFLIVLSHCCVHTGWDDISTNRYFLVSGLSLGEVGVASFVIITGFFSWKNNFKTKSFLRVVLQVIFYSFVCFVCIKLFIPENDLTWTEFPLFPIISGEYWFPTTFVALMLLQPLLNGWIEYFKKTSLKKIIGVLTCLLIVFPFFIKGQFVYSNLLYFVYLYLIGAYIGKYPKRFDSLSFSKLVIGFFISFLVFVCLMAFAIYHPDIMGCLDISRKTLLNQNSIPAVLMGIFLFLVFRKIDIGSNSFINKMATTSFGIYLISDNPNMRPLVWDWANNNAFANADIMVFIGHILLSVLVVYAICSMLDYLRIALVETPFFRLFEKPINYLAVKFDAFMILDNTQTKA